MHPSSLDRTVSLIYQASSGKVSWEEALEAVRIQLGSLIVQIVCVNSAQGSFVFSFESKLAPSVTASATLDYALNYHRIDPHAEYVRNGPCGKLISFSEVFDETYVENSPFYQDFLIPYGSRHMHGAKLAKSNDKVVMLGIHRSPDQGALIGEELELARRLCMHLSEAARMYVANIETSRDSAIAHALVTRLPEKVYVLDLELRLLWKNALAQQHIAKYKTFLPDEQGHVRCAHKGLKKFLQATIDDFSQVSLTDIDVQKHCALRTIDFEINGADVPHLVCARLIVPMHSMQTFGSEPVIMVIIRSMAKSDPLDPFLVASVFNLTPAESQVACGVASGLPPKSIAKKNDVSLYTVQAHLRSIHKKLNVSKNTELAALLHSVIRGI